MKQVVTFPQISFEHWWHTQLHISFYKLYSISWISCHDFHWNFLLNELEQIAPQSIKNWIFSKNNNVSSFLISQIYLSAMISSQSVPLLTILASSLTTCHSRIKSTLIFLIFFWYFRILSFLYLRDWDNVLNSSSLSLSPVLSPANSTIAIHYTLAGIWQAISTNFNAFKNPMACVITNSLKFHKMYYLQSNNKKLYPLTYKTLANQQPRYHQWYSQDIEIDLTWV